MSPPSPATAAVAAAAVRMENYCMHQSVDVASKWLTGLRHCMAWIVSVYPRERYACKWEGAGKIYHVIYHFTYKKIKNARGTFFISNFNFNNISFPAFSDTDILSRFTVNKTIN